MIQYIIAGLIGATAGLLKDKSSKKSFAKGGKVSDLKIELEKLDSDGNTSVMYDQDTEEYYWEDYENDTYRDGFDNEEEAYEDLISHLNNFAKGGKTASKKFDYTSKANLGTLTIKHDGKTLEIAPKDYLNGAYEFGKGGRLSDDYKYIKKYDVVSIESKDGKEVSPVNGFWVKKSALDNPAPAKKETKAKASKSTKRVSVPRPIKYDKQDPSKSEAFMKVIGAFTGRDVLRPAMQYINVDERITATDGHLLATFPNPVGKSESELICPPSKKCTADMKYDGGKFPNYKAIVRLGQDEGLLGSIKDVSEVYKELKRHVDSNKYMSVGGKRKTAYNVFNVLLDFDDMSGNKALVNAELLLKVLKACLQLGWYKISLGQSGGKTTPIFVTDNNPRKSKEEGGVFLIMPVYDDGRYQSYEPMDGPNNSRLTFTKSGDFKSLEEMPRYKSKFEDGGVTADEEEQLDLPF